MPTTPTYEVIASHTDSNVITVDNEMFGFDLPWAEFQSGYQRNGAIKENLLELLKPFRGALYRYPGGNYFLWENSILNTAARKPNFTEFLSSPQPKFGLQEYLTFLKDVDGKGLYMLNLLGEKGQPYNRNKVQESNKKLIRWVKAHPQGHRIQYWELANELDWRPFNFSAAEYIEKMQGTLAVAKQEYPSEKFVVAGRTNPWQEGKKSEIEFNNLVGQAYPFYGIALHAYYDGYPMPMMADTIKRYGQVKNSMGQPLKVFVTEHGRWPSEKATGRWEDNWYQASGSLGAISASDFTLMSLNMPEVATTVWHALGVHGPWQLIQRNPANDSLFPSATYWALRTLREGFLKQVVPILPHTNKSGGYGGGYTLRLTAMRGDNNAISVLGVNRGTAAVRINLKLKSESPFKVSAINTTELDLAGADNTAQNPAKFAMRTSTPNTSASKQFNFCAPPFSVFSVLASGA